MAAVTDKPAETVVPPTIAIVQTPVPEEAKPETPKEEVIAAANLPVPDATPVTEPEPVKKEAQHKDIPFAPENIIEKKDGPETASGVTGPPLSVTDIPEKKVPEPAKPVVPIAKIESKTEAVQEPPKVEKPKTELDLLKSKFDKVVYAKPAPTTPPPHAIETPKAEVPKTVTPEETPVQVVKETATSNAPKFYTVKKGDTAFSIAKANGITVRQLREWNELDFAEIKVGQKLRVKQ
jgi:LysM repeat protein